MMQAAVMRGPGGPEVLHIETIPVPVPKPGQVLIKVKAFGLNRSELFTRQGHSPDVQFPRVLGIEAVGVVEHAPGGEFAVGDTIATVMGGMGRQFDGGYAEFTCVPANQIRKFSSELPWEIIGAVPEMFQTAWGSVFKALDLQPGERLLIRGGSTSVGLAAAGLARNHGAYVLSTTRQATRTALLLEHGANEAVVDDGHLGASTEKVDKVLELVGTGTLADSLLCARPGGAVCMAGMVGDRWAFDNFAPMDVIPNYVRLTTYSGGVPEFMAMPLDSILADIAAGKLKVPLGPSARLGDVVVAHRWMEQNQAAGKIVVLTT
ncbi:zinc-binding alcohol dehydrogenase family protein [Devosia neptuniae]|uniref:Zinc-binding alcohol dehydrogenase family protein n=1 Tax=Devosia neptuniae TaxID=191302 RepID=A0ABY6CFQ7_9HYPH|nr:zinc-binding alcohol dehydrogenase family protein [Devosia neptuniae]UXN71074.1 zinc-binding alcohol dehydrogenase family protein [Devosia neptuniae]